MGKRVLECRSPFTLARIRYFLGREVAVSHALATPMLRKIHVLFPPAQERRNITRLGPKNNRWKFWLTHVLNSGLLVSNFESVRLQRDHQRCVLTARTTLGSTRTRDRRRSSGKQSTVATWRPLHLAACNPLRSAQSRCPLFCGFSHGLRPATAPELRRSPLNQKITVIKMS